MDFYAVLDQIVALLQGRGRVTYRALKLHFHLDDETLGVVKDELLYGQPQAVEADDTGLVWTGAPPTAVPDPCPQTAAERQLHLMVLAVTALLQREQRVTYRTLQYVFDVDEACLHVVRDELCFRHLAREEGGQGLVWTGADLPPVAPPRPPHPPRP